MNFFMKILCGMPEMDNLEEYEVIKILLYGQIDNEDLEEVYFATDYGIWGS
jgi:hypothetical protein